MLSTVRLVSVEAVKSTLWAALFPLRVTIPADVMIPVVREMLPPTVRLLAAMARVPEASARVPVTVTGPPALQDPVPLKVKLA